MPIGVSTETVIEKLYIDEAPLTFKSDYTNENAKSYALTYTELSSWVSEGTYNGLSFLSYTSILNAEVSFVVNGLKSYDKLKIN